MDLLVKTVRTISTDELNIYCEPPLVFSARGYITRAINEQLLAWDLAGRPISLTLGLLPQLFFSVSVDTQVFPILSQVDSEALRQAIETANPGGGDEFLTALVDGYWVNHYRFFTRRRPASANLLADSTNGTSPAE